MEGMTPAELKSTRRALGLTAQGFAVLVRYKTGRTVRRWERVDSPIPGPVVAMLDMMRDERRSEKHDVTRSR